jgi:prepilin-type N-terminal cleavage/methylation domain-containing protein
MSQEPASRSSRRRVRPTSGFTLIELLVVISIIALLISLLLPALGRARGVARTVACGTYMKQFGVGFMLYTNDHDGNFAPVRPTSASDEYGPWWHSIRPYFGLDAPRWATSRDLYINPSDNSYTDNWVGQTVPGLSCPQQETYNFDDGPGGGFGMNLGPLSPDQDTRLESVDRSTFILTDSALFFVFNPGYYTFFEDVDDDGFLDSGGSTSAFYRGAPWYDKYNYFHPRHPGGSGNVTSMSDVGPALDLDDASANFLFTDMHVDSRTFRQWLTNADRLWSAP